MTSELERRTALYEKVAEAYAGHSAEDVFAVSAAIVCAISATSDSPQQAYADYLEALAKTWREGQRRMREGEITP